MEFSFASEAGTGNVGLGIISIQQLFKAMRLEEVTQVQHVDKEEGPAVSSGDPIYIYLVSPLQFSQLQMQLCVCAQSLSCLTLCKCTLTALKNKRQHQVISRYAAMTPQTTLNIPSRVQFPNAACSSQISYQPRVVSYYPETEQIGRLGYHKP